MAIRTFRKTDFIAPEGAQATNSVVVIAVDGPAASGKGTLAKKLAERLGYACLDTGALYRAVGLAVLEMGGDPSNPRDALLALDIVKRNLTPELLSNPALRTPAVSDAASKAAVLPDVRAGLLDYQRAFAKNPPGGASGAVLDGRDIGTVICPDADIKLFVTASEETRARRRAQELGEDFSADAMLDLQKRDTRDATRSTAPTKPAEDAYVIDTTALTISQTVEEAIAVIRAKFLAETNDNGG